MVCISTTDAIQIMLELTHPANKTEAQIKQNPSGWSRDGFFLGLFTYYLQIGQKVK